MKTLPQLAALAVAAALALPAYAQLPGVPGMKQKEVDKLSKGDIAKEMVFKNGDIDKCKDEQKKKDPKVTGILAARFKVDTDGSTTEVRIMDPKLQGSTFGQCMERTIKGWKFSKAKQKSDNYDVSTSF
jgi:hypothetical protein